MIAARPRRLSSALLLTAAAATAGLWIVSRGKWSDAIIDSGTEWIYADALERGQKLYRPCCAGHRLHAQLWRGSDRHGVPARGHLLPACDRGRFQFGEDVPQRHSLCLGPTWSTARRFSDRMPARSTLTAFIGGLWNPPGEPYTPVPEWVRRNVREKKSIWVAPGYMTYPLMRIVLAGGASRRLPARPVSAGADSP